MNVFREPSYLSYFCKMQTTELMKWPLAQGIDIFKCCLEKNCREAAQSPRPRGALRARNLCVRRSSLPSPALRPFSQTCLSVLPGTAAQREELPIALEELAFGEKRMEAKMGNKVREGFRSSPGS